MYKHKKIDKLFMAFFMSFLMILSITGCGGGTKGDSAKSKNNEAEALEEVNEIPEDGIITKEQFKTVAGEDKEIQFTGETEDGISYTWTYDAAKIQNPDDQNLKIDFTGEGLDEIKTQADNALDALKMTMHGKGMIAVPKLTVVLPEVWESDTGLLLKEQGGKLARMSDVTIEKNAEEQEDEKDGQTGTTTLTMSVTSLEGDCYIVGGITENQNKGADAANKTKKDTETETEEESEEQEEDTSEEEQYVDETGESSDDTSDEDVENDVKTENTAMTCTISISCATILDNTDDLAEGKEEFVPADGLILAPSTIEFEEGESVHDILKRVCKEAEIHMESTYTPVYESAYVEGINQLYEFDCGDQSGWMYSVNGWFPNYGCSKYTVSDGDEIEWVYTCDLGKDVGDNSMH